MSSTDDYLDSLYREGMRIRDEWFATYCANLNRLSETLGSAQRFVTDLGHLVPPKPAPAPLAEPPRADHATSMPWDDEDLRPGPPPLPDDYQVAPPGTYPESESGNAFGARLAARTGRGQ